MKKFISDVSLLDLIPFNFKDDEDTLYILKSIDHILRKFIANIPEVILLDRINELEEWKVDELALDLHVDYYREDLDIEQKRELIKTSLLTHRTKGTPFAVEMISTILFGAGKVQEWFEYSGQVARFKITTAGDLKDEKDFQKVIEVINIYKNLRSWLDSLTFKRDDQSNLYFGHISKRKNVYILNSAIINIPDEVIENNLGITTQELRKIRLK